MVALVPDCTCCAGALLFSTHWDAYQRFPPMDRPRTGYLSAVRVSQTGRDFFPRRVVRPLRNSEAQRAF